MKWIGGRSVNIEDHRGRRGVGRGAVGGVGGLLVAVVLSLLFGRDFVSDMTGGGGGGAPAIQPDDGQPYQASAEEARLEDHIAHALGDLEATWRPLLGERWRDSTLRLYTGGTDSGCGYGDSAVGPFYCPADGKVYIDLSFFAQLDRELGAPGDFAQAYVLAHEIGHHVQNLLGLEKGGRQSNAQLVMQELQADCYAGVWGHYAIKKGQLEAGDLEEGLRAAASIGDDTLQKKAGRQVQPESFTHGSSAQRVAWFKRGIERGRPEDCDTFADSGLGGR